MGSSYKEKMYYDMTDEQIKEKLAKGYIEKASLQDDGNVFLCQSKGFVIINNEGVTIDSAYCD